jgi:CO/xanthine dehydrogenase FAD-binding subunit
MTKRKSHLTLAVDSTKKHPDPEPLAGGAAVKPMMKPNDNMVCFLSKRYC